MTNYISAHLRMERVGWGEYDITYGGSLTVQTSGTPVKIDVLFAIKGDGMPTSFLLKRGEKQMYFSPENISLDYKSLAANPAQNVDQEVRVNPEDGLDKFIRPLLN